MKAVILGSGTSHGIPVVACSCPVCTSSNPKNNRTRCSCWIYSETASIIIDTGPEFRVQAVRERIRSLDAIFLTHAHADHIHGLDDIRPFCWDKIMPVYGTKNTLKEVKERFSYIFKKTQLGGGKPKISLSSLDSIQKQPINGLNLIPIPVKHGRLDILGYRIGNFAYITDCSFISESSMLLLQGLDTLILGALRHKSHETHFSISEAVEVVKKLKPNQTFFTHLCHDEEHQALTDELKELLPMKIAPAYDGLSIIIQ